LVRVRQKGERNYRNAEKRLSNEFDDTTGAAPGIEAGGVGASLETAGLNGGRAVATCFGSAGLSAVFSAIFSLALGDGAGFAAAMRCGACRGVTAFGFAGAGFAEAELSLPPRPILRAKLLKMLSDSAEANSADDGLVTATTGSDEAVWMTELAAGSCGGLTVAGMVPGAGE
jgi:hypothetical protein